MLFNEMFDLLDSGPSEKCDLLNLFERISFLRFIWDEKIPGP